MAVAPGYNCKMCWGFAPTLQTFQLDSLILRDFVVNGAAAILKIQTVDF